MSTDTKLTTTTTLLDTFKAERHAYGDNGVVWTTYCKVTGIYRGHSINQTTEVNLKKSRDGYYSIELTDLNCLEDGEKAKFSTAHSTVTYSGGVLNVAATKKGSFCNLAIGAYDADFVAKYLS